MSLAHIGNSHLILKNPVDSYTTSHPKMDANGYKLKSPFKRIVGKRLKTKLFFVAKLQSSENFRWRTLLADALRPKLQPLFALQTDSVFISVEPAGMPASGQDSWDWQG
jgi:hypothetical protein